MEFQEFPKMYRFSRDVIVTEKIDGTNAQIFIEELEGYIDKNAFFQKDGLAMYIGSRSRWVDETADNHGFAKWCRNNQEELLELGPGRHFGEWWGSGIQRGYDLPNGEKRFSLFNVSRWTEDRPACCHVVPELWRGNLDDLNVPRIMTELKAKTGSLAAPGFMNPEGIVIFHTGGNFCLKKTFEKDDQGKWAQ